MTIKEKLGKKIYDYIKSQGLTVMTNEKAEQQITELEERELALLSIIQELDDDVYKELMRLRAASPKLNKH